ncbi:hypothetical protein PRZ48_011927 [Zasmidium cellare]|uniref:BTB domain-containing protein n=1 Tax=Zasmidium cellare TaxID=395010 RepID=A0ABR0E7R8_ZASCE|nr:hypothetical protein PRZ48_011927 [Zasmidium cellare]
MADARDYRVFENTKFEIPNSPDLLEIVVGSEQHLYNMEYSMLWERSPRFKTYVESQAPLKPLNLNLPHISSNTFRTYVMYVYRGQLCSKTPGRSPGFASELMKLARLYMLAEELQDRDAKDAATTGIIAAYIDAVSRNRSSAPSVNLLRKVCDRSNVNGYLGFDARSSWPRPNTRAALDCDTLELLFLQAVVETPGLLGPTGPQHVTVCKYHIHAAGVPCLHRKSPVEMLREKEHDALPRDGMAHVFPQGQRNDSVAVAGIENFQRVVASETGMIQPFQHTQFHDVTMPHFNGPPLQQNQSNGMANAAFAQNNQHTVASQGNGIQPHAHGPFPNFVPQQQPQNNDGGFMGQQLQGNYGTMAPRMGNNQAAPSGDGEIESYYRPDFQYGAPGWNNFPPEGDYGWDPRYFP